MNAARRQVFSDAELLALSTVCWFCGSGDPVEVRERKPCCEKCAMAFRETFPPPDPEGK